VGAWLEELKEEVEKEYEEEVEEYGGYLRYWVIMEYILRNYP
jgi:hypothetical protein